MKTPIYQVTFLPSGIEISVPEHTTILEAARLAGLSIESPCGGNGTCQKCMVTVFHGDDVQTVSSCKYHISDSVKVELPVSNQQLEILTESDTDFSQLSIAPIEGEQFEQCYLAACDLGSTTIVLYLFDGKSGTLLATVSDKNPQTSISADVIGRIEYAKTNGSEQLTTMVRTTVSNLLIDACNTAHILSKQISHICLVGNCCMHHFFLGIPTDSLAIIPYSPSVKEALVLPAKNYNLPLHPGAYIQTLPNIAGFVGADTVACLVSANFDTREEITLLLDIGTNGELVLGNKYRRVSCSTAAGPALEGAKITCGMRGTSGAIDHAWLANDTINISVINQQKPVGICGSGLIDLVGLFLQLRIIDESGRFADPDSWPDPNAYININGMTAYQVAESVYITQKDIRELQLAKAAIAAGIHLMCDYMDISVSAIETVFIAGAFGNYMNPINACKIGLVPSSLLQRIKPIGNAAGAGACLCVLNQEHFHRAESLAKSTEFIELASLPDFQDVFIDELEFYNS